MRRRVFTAISFLMALAVSNNTLQAQQSKLLTLNEAIELSISNNNQLKNDKAIVDQASASVKEMMDARLPELGVSGSYMYLPVTPTINSNLMKGGDSAAGPKVSQAMYGMVSASVPIYTGGRFKYGIESAKYLEKAASLDAEASREDVVFNTIDAFANLYKAKEAMAIVQQDLVEAQQRVKDFSSMEKNGLLARNDLLKAQLLVSKVELSLLDAENSFKIANTNMAIMLGLPRQTQLIPDSASLHQSVVGLKPLEDYEQLAYQNRKDLEALSYRRKAAQGGIKTAQADYYPSIALTGGYAAVEVPNLLSAYNVVNVGVGIKYSISSLWKTDAKVQKAKAVEQQVEANQAMLRDNVQLQVNKVYQQYLLTKKRIEVYKQAIDQANENYKITKNKYDNGLATTTDLIDADIIRMESELNYSISKTDATVAYNKLLQTAGLLYNK